MHIQAIPFQNGWSLQFSTTQNTLTSFQCEHCEHLRSGTLRCCKKLATQFRQWTCGHTNYACLKWLIARITQTPSQVFSVNIVNTYVVILWDAEKNWPLNSGGEHVYMQAIPFQDGWSLQFSTTQTPSQVFSVNIVNIYVVVLWDAVKNWACKSGSEHVYMQAIPFQNGWSL